MSDDTPIPGFTTTQKDGTIVVLRDLLPAAIAALKEVLAQRRAALPEAHPLVQRLALELKGAEDTLAAMTAMKMKRLPISIKQGRELHARVTEKYSKEGLPAPRDSSWDQRVARNLANQDKTEKW